MHIPQIYLTQGGVVITQMDSRTEWSDSSDDYVLKKIVLRAEKQPVEDEFDLVAYVDVELTEGSVGGVEIYRIPFPECQSLRFQILRLIQKQPKFYAH